MPVPVHPASVTAYAAFPPELDRDWFGRVCHLSEADLAVIRRRTGPVTQLGYAVQLATVRALGTFFSDPTAVPEPVVAALASQLGIDDVSVLAGYGDMPVRWRHTAEIRDRYGYRDFTAQPDRFAFLSETAFEGRAECLCLAGRKRLGRWLGDDRADRDHEAQCQDHQQ